MTDKINTHILPGAGPAGPEFTDPYREVDEPTTDSQQPEVDDDTEELTQSGENKRYFRRLMARMIGNDLRFAGGGILIGNTLIDALNRNNDATPQEQVARLIAVVAGVLIATDAIRDNIQRIKSYRASYRGLSEEDTVDPGATKER